jgi:hypothetical protein
MHKFHWHKEDFEHKTPYDISHQKRICSNVIAFTPWMTIKSQIHAIHTTRRSTTFLHCKKLKKNLAIVLSWEDLDLFNLKLLKVLQVFLWS